MKRKGYRIATALAAALGVALSMPACSSDDSSEGISGFIAEYCSLLAPCCAQAGLPSDGAQCRQLLTALAGGQDYDDAKGQACLAAMRAASSNPEFCSFESDSMDSSGACDGVFSSSGSSGTVPPGGACSSSSDCASSPKGEVDCHHRSEYANGSWTETATCLLEMAGTEGSSPCFGTKDGNMTSYQFGDGPTPPEGYLCDTADGLYCDADTSACAKTGALGESCSSWSKPCQDGLYCEMATSTCAPRVPQGSACTGSDACGDGLYCASGSTCAPRLATGAPCSSSDQCLSDWCMNSACEPEQNLGLSLICGG